MAGPASPARCEILTASLVGALEVGTDGDMLQSVYLQNFLVIILRVVLFLSCRRLLSNGLYHDLQHLTSDASSPSTDSEVDPNRISTSFSSAVTDPPEIELNSLPLPNTTSSGNGAAAAHDTIAAGVSKTGSRAARRASFHSTVARNAFATCFSESCIMFSMLMFQGLDILTPTVRLLNWKLSLSLLLALILLIIPLSLSLVLNLQSPPASFSSGDRTSAGASRRRMLSPRLVLYLVPVVLWLFGLSYVPLPAALSSSDILTGWLSRLIVIGTIILGLLSGFGATSNIWLYLRPFRRSQSTPSEGDLASAERSLAQIRCDLRSRKTEHQRKEVAGPGGSSWISRVATSFRGDEYQQEIQGLEALEGQMAQNVETLRAQREHERYSRTFTGWLINQGGRFFALYCVARILSSLSNLLLPSRSTSAKNNSDIISELLAYVISLSNPLNISPETVAHIAHQISLGFVGIIILTSLRLALRGVTRVLRVTSRNLGASLMLLLLAQLMGIYLLSTIVQLRTSFPPLPQSPPIGGGIDDLSGASPDKVASVVNLFSTVPAYEVFGSLFDWAFLFAAAGTGVVKWGAKLVND